MSSFGGRRAPALLLPSPFNLESPQHVWGPFREPRRGACKCASFQGASLGFCQMLGCVWRLAEAYLHLLPVLSNRRVPSDSRVLCRRRCQRSTRGQLSALLPARLQSVDGSISVGACDVLSVGDSDGAAVSPYTRLHASQLRGPHARVPRAPRCCWKGFFSCSLDR